MINNQNGLLVISFAIVLPLFFSILFAFISIGTTISSHLRISYACYTHSLKTQSVISKNIKKLTDLNSIAKQFRTKRLILKAKLAASTAAQTYSLTIALQKELYALQLKQMTLQLKQKKIITQTYFSIKSQFSRGISEVKTHSTIIRAKSPQFSIIKKHGYSLSPEYYPSLNFSEKSISLIRAQVTRKSIALKVFESLSNSKNKRLIVSCSAKNYKREGQWLFRLSEAY